MSATEDLAEYIRSFKTVKEKPFAVRSIPDTESIDTNELLSEMSSEVSVEVKPRKVHTIMSVQKLKQQRLDTQKRAKPQRRTPLKVVQEEDEVTDVAHSSYNLSDYLPREDSGLVPSKSQPTQLRQPVRLKKPRGKRLYGDTDAQSTISSVDTEALLQSSDEEDEECSYSLPRTLPSAVRQLTPTPKTKSEKEAPRTAPKLPQHSSQILETIRSRGKTTETYQKPQFIGDAYPKPPVSDATYSKGPTGNSFARGTDVYQKREEQQYSKSPYVKENHRQGDVVDSAQGADWLQPSPYHVKRDTADFRYQPNVSQTREPDPYVQEVGYKASALSCSTSHTSILPAKRLQLVSVGSISIVPGVTTRSQASEFSLNDPLQSSRKIKVPSVPETVRVYNSMASVPMEAMLRSTYGQESARSRESYGSGSEEKTTSLLVCTCILAGELRRHLPTCRKVTVAAMLPSNPASLTSSTSYMPSQHIIEKPVPKPLKTSIRRKAKPSILQATVRIQRAFRRFLRLRRVSKPIKEIETWTLEEPLNEVPRVQTQSEAPQTEPELPDAERATRSLFHALDQLRVLRDLASSASSRETSFTLSESAISREVTPTQSRLIHPRSPVLQHPEEDDLDSPTDSKDEDYLNPGEGETSIDTDILLRSTESLDLA